jgi:hypothetical protein
MDNQQVSSCIEVWKLYEDEPRYEVSTLGRVRHVADKSIKYSKPDKIGYIYIQYKTKGEIKNLKVHRMVAKTFLVNPDSFPEVNHKDGVKSNNCVDNLEWCNRQANVAHGHALGLYNRKGTKNGRAVLTEDVVHALCAWYASSLDNTPKLAVDIFGVSIQQTSKIRCGVAWKHISCQYNIEPIVVRKNSRD